MIFSAPGTPARVRTRSLPGLVCLAAAVILASCDDGSGPDGLRFGQIGEVEIQVDASLGNGIGALQQIVTWSSDGPWESTERIFYKGRLGDETVAHSRQDPGTLARYYGSWIALVNDSTPLQLFLGDRLAPQLDPVCPPGQSRITVRIRDAERSDSIGWTRCGDGMLGSLTTERAGPDLPAARVIQAAQLVRNYTVGTSFLSAYNGSLPFATLDRGEQSKASLTVPRVIEDQLSWVGFWALHTGTGAAPPAVDFDKEVVLIAAIGTRGEAGDSVEVRSVLPIGTGTQITLWERRPGNFCTPAPRAHSPFHVVVAPVVPRPIFFSVADVDQVPCG